MGASASVKIVSLSAEELAQVRVFGWRGETDRRQLERQGGGLTRIHGLPGRESGSRSKFDSVHKSKTQVAEQEHLPFVVAQTIRKNDIDGATLNELAPEDMDDLAANNLDRKKLRGALNRR